MEKALTVVFVASEAAPFAKEGGLGDVAGALPKRLWRDGHDVRLVMPRYYGVDKARWGLRPVGGPLGVPMGSLGTLWAGVYEGRLPGAGPPAYFLEHDALFGRAGGLYTDGNGLGYADNDRRFLFLSRGALELCRALALRPDVIHVHDWQTAAVPVLLDTLYRGDPLLAGTPSLLTVHNIQHQGDFDPGVLGLLGVGPERFNARELEHYGRLNLLKGGLVHATLLSTVSPTYAREIQNPELGYGLEGVVRSRSADLAGIMNGADYEEWSPEVDPLIPARYSASDLSGKAVCKAELQRSLGLEVRPDVPLFGMVARLVYQKGVDLLAGAVERMLGMDIQLAVLGTGEGWAQSFLASLSSRHPGRFACRIATDNAIAHRIQAGADFFLMPSRFEPCGLSQLYALRYGTPPVVRSTGGLNDTVEDFDDELGRGTGFKFRAATPEALYYATGRAARVFRASPAELVKLRQRAMGRRFLWETSAREYEKLYRAAIEKAAAAR